MFKITDDFIRFLKANYPDDFRKVTSEGVKEDVINSIVSRREGDYEIWCKIPEWVKNRYGDDLPDEVFNGNKSVKEFVHEERMAKEKEEEDNKELINYGVSLLAVGYAVESVNELVRNKEERNRILRNAKGRGLDKEEREKYLETRERDRLAIVKDWKENQQEKYFMYLVKALAKTKKGANEATSAGVKAGYEMKEASLRREFKDICLKLKDEDFKQRLETHIRTGCVFECVRKIDKDVFEEVRTVLMENGIDVDKIREQRLNEDFYDKDNLVSELKRQYERRIAKGIKDCSFGDMEKVREVVEDKVSPKLVNRVLMFEQNVRA